MRLCKDSTNPPSLNRPGGDECLECVVLAGPAPHGCGDDHQRLEQALASTRHSPRGLARSGADESFPCAGGPNCPLATNLPRYCGQDRQAISARCAPSQPGTRGAPPINKSRPRPTKQGRGRGFESVSSSSARASLPLNGGRGLGGHVEEDAVDLGHRVGDARRDAGQDVVGQARPVGRHRVLRGHGAQR